MIFIKLLTSQAAIVLLGLVGQSIAIAEVSLVNADLAIEPIPEYQAHINRALEAITEKNREHKHENAGRVMEELSILRDLARGNDKELVRQLAYAASNWPRPQETIVILDFFGLLRTNNDAIIAGLAPYLDVEDGVLGELTRLCFHNIGGGKWAPDRPLEPVNYIAYSQYIERQLDRGEPLAEPFVRWIYQQAPNYALLAFLYADGRVQPEHREVLWSEHVVSDAIWRKENGFSTEFQSVKRDAISALHKLSINKSWWARLYVAEILQQYPEFRTDALTQHLIADENKLVRETMAGRGLKKD